MGLLTKSSIMIAIVLLISNIVLKFNISLWIYLLVVCSPFIIYHSFTAIIFLIMLAIYGRDGYADLIETHVNINAPENNQVKKFVNFIRKKKKKPIEKDELQEILNKILEKIEKEKLRRKNEEEEKK